MIIKKMILEGDWVEAHLYFDFLWLIGRDGNVSAFDVEGFIDAGLNGEASAARRLFARNDLLPTVDGSMTASALNKDVRDLLAGTEPIRVSATDVERHSFHFARQEELSNALDVRFYYGRAFVSVPAALVQFEASGRDALSDGSRRGVVRNSQLGSARVFDEGTPLQVHCRYGAVSLSCGAEGGWYALGALSDDRSWRVDASRFAHTSFASEVLAGALGNVGQEEVLDLFQTQTKPTLRSPRRNAGDQSVEAREVTSVDPEPDPLAKNREQAFRRQTGTEVEQTFLTSTKAFYLLSDGSMRMLALSRDNALLHGTPKPIRYPAPEGRVVGTTTTAGRIVVETDDDIQILDRNRWTTIFEEPVYRVRGYPASRWYKQLLSIVARGRTELLFICDD